jgi:hypothetical protein
MENICVFIDMTLKRCRNRCKFKLCEKHERITQNKKIIMETIENIKLSDVDYREINL